MLGLMIEAVSFATLPNSVFFPVLITIPLPLPETTAVPEKAIFFASKIALIFNILSEVY